MKNMKKTIIGVAIIAMFLITMMGSVNAASMTASADKVEVDKGVSVRITTTVPIKAAQFKLAYDTSKFEYTGAAYDGKTQSAGTTTGDVGTITPTADGLTVAIANNGAKDTTKTIRLDFKAKAETANASEETFTVTGFKAGTSSQRDDSINSTVTVKVEAAKADEPVITPEEPDNSGNDNNGTSTPAQGNNNNGTTSTKTNGGVVGTDGKTHTKLNQTGAPLFIGAAVVVALAGVVLVVRKRK